MAQYRWVTQQTISSETPTALIKLIICKYFSLINLKQMLGISELSVLICKNVCCTASKSAKSVNWVIFSIMKLKFFAFVIIINFSINNSIEQNEL